jgi:hypothetical protein
MNDSLKKSIEAISNPYSHPALESCRTSISDAVKNITSINYDIGSAIGTLATSDTIKGVNDIAPSVGNSGLKTL